MTSDRPWNIAFYTLGATTCLLTAYAVASGFLNAGVQTDISVVLAVVATLLVFGLFLIVAEWFRTSWTEKHLLKEIENCKQGIRYRTSDAESTENEKEIMEAQRSILNLQLKEKEAQAKLAKVRAFRRKLSFRR